ncbi:thymidine phosphorylase family protein [Paremcibacter congregatus]|uniref:thymidine phosphorylase family protein n=1 Tax=Paremcibacter congregatus TaxID=2043170 RepID=UPI0030EC0C17|tara:strand:- start:7509 stop:9017 length:1509 start_codon:yes stop_codon:yes gene_type:complete
MTGQNQALILSKLDIESYKEAVIYMREDCHVCSSEGLTAHARVRVSLGDKYVIATLNTIGGALLEEGHAGLSKFAWNLLGAQENDRIIISHALPVSSLSHVRSKIYGNNLSAEQIQEIIEDITAGRFSDIQISAFLTACAGGRMDVKEIISLTRSMSNTGERLDWGVGLVVDKHCVGGLPGNRTTPIVVSIVAAYGLTIPKTSSRAITSPAGTADTMEVLCPVELDIKKMRQVVEQEQGCIVWGGSVALSPADDVLIQIEKALDLDSEAQLVASVLSKKISAGSNHVLIDIPVGPTAKVRTPEMANILENYLTMVGTALGINVRVHTSDGSRPVGRGIGPALEARDLVSVLRNDDLAPVDLKERAVALAGYILEFSPDVAAGKGREIAQEILKSGQAWKKFQAICEAQGGMRDIPEARFQHIVHAPHKGRVELIDNRKIAKIAKLAGAPYAAAAGVDLHIQIGEALEKDMPLYTIHAESRGELSYTLNYINQGNHIIQITEL